MNLDYALSQLTIISINLHLLGLNQISNEIKKFANWMCTRPHKNEDSLLPPNLIKLDDEYELECMCSAMPEAYTYNVPSINRLVSNYYLGKALDWLADIYSSIDDMHIQKSISSYTEAITKTMSVLSEHTYS